MCPGGTKSCTEAGNSHTSSTSQERKTLLMPSSGADFHHPVQCLSWVLPGQAPRRGPGAAPGVFRRALSENLGVDLRELCDRSSSANRRIVCELAGGKGKIT